METKQRRQIGADRRDTWVVGTRHADVGGGVSGVMAAASPDAAASREQFTDGQMKRLLEIAIFPGGLSDGQGAPTERGFVLVGYRGPSGFGETEEGVLVARYIALFHCWYGEHGPVTSAVMEAVERRRERICQEIRAVQRAKGQWRNTCLAGAGSGLEGKGGRLS